MTIAQALISLALVVALWSVINEQFNRNGPPWKELSRLEWDLWIERANEMINKLDMLGY